MQTCAKRESARWSLDELPAPPGAVSKQELTFTHTREQQLERVDCTLSSFAWDEQFELSTSALGAQIESNEEWVTADDEVLQRILNGWDAEASGEAQSASDTSRSSALVPDKALTAMPPPAAAKPPIAWAWAKGSSSLPRTERPQFAYSSSRRKLEIQTLRIEAYDLDGKLRRLKEFARALWPKGQQELTSVAASPPLWKAKWPFVGD